MIENYHRIEFIFDKLLNCSDEERTLHGEELCGGDKKLWLEVQSLLEAADNADGFLTKQTNEISHTVLNTGIHDGIQGQRFGPYKIVREVERGGMGVVFLAERADGHYQSRVAIKVSNQGIISEESIQRFHEERQILANLRHPYIAQLLDGGTSENGQPYLVMELIEGEPIDIYCAKKEFAAIEILSLLLKVCDAVRYAHQNLIIHCDLKPANILVSEDGVPKLLDFGIARLMKPDLLMPTTEQHCSPEGDLLSRATPLTPEYAAPEQLTGGSITTTADVYSLGVLLYKLLTDKLPCKIDNNESLHSFSCKVANTEIARPSVIAPMPFRKHLHSDLDNIVMKALQSDAAFRYNSVQLLMDDIGCYLSCLPVLASKNTNWYRSQKFIKRHKWGVLLGAMALVFLLLGSITSTWQWLVARDQQRQSEHRLQEVHELTSLIVFELPRSIADLPESTALNERLIRKGVNYLDELTKVDATNPKFQRELATAYFKLARLQGGPLSVNLGDAVLARSNYKKAVTMQERLLDNLSSNVADSNSLMIELAASYMFLGALEATSFDDLNAAKLYTQKCLNLLQPTVSSQVNMKLLKQQVDCHTLAAHWYNAAGQPMQAKTELLRVEQQYKLLGEQHPFVLSTQGQRIKARVHEEWAEIESQTGNPQAALQRERLRFAIILEIMSELKAPNRFIGTANHALAFRLAEVGQLFAAESAYHKAIMHWQKRQQKLPSDVNGTHTLAVINAELAALYVKIADLSPLRQTAAQAELKVCAHYSKSFDLLAQLPGVRNNFPQRYTWSPSTNQIISKYNAYCPPPEKKY